MKNFILLLLSLSIGTASFTQPELKSTPKHTEQLAYLCKVWGFLKYYSPDVARKKVNWDKTLITMFPSFEAELSHEEFQEKINGLIIDAFPKSALPQIIPSDEDIAHIQENQWMEALGLDKSKLESRVSFSWMFNPIFSRETSLQLSQILIHYTPVNSKYTGGKFAIKHQENDWLEWDTIYKPHYFLAAARYWNIINYFFPYKHLMDTPWDAVLKQEIPNILEAQEYWAFRRVMQRLNHSIQDSHGVLYAIGRKYIPPSQQKTVTEKKGYPPYILRYIDSKLYVDLQLQDSLRLQPKDEIISLNGFSIDSTKSAIFHYNSHSTPQAFDADFENVTNYKLAASFEYGIVRQGDTLFVKEDKHISAAKKNQQYYRNAPFWYSIDDAIGYIDLTEIGTFSFKKALRNLREKETLIFDLRGYPRSLAPLLFPYLLEKQHSDVACFQYAEKDYPGTFKHAKKALDYKFWYIHAFIPFARRYKGEIAVLIDNNAISYSETTAMILKSAGNKVIFYGLPTKGANGNVAAINLPGGLKSRYSSLDWHYPNHEILQRNGILPDVEIPLTTVDLGNGNDVRLNKLIFLLQDKNQKAQSLLN